MGLIESKGCREAEACIDMDTSLHPGREQIKEAAAGVSQLSLQGGSREGWVFPSSLGSCLVTPKGTKAKHLVQHP